MDTDNDTLRCYEYNKCGREEVCIGAMYNDECWTRAGSYADPPVVICMLLEQKLITDCDSCSFFRVTKKMLELKELITSFKQQLRLHGTDNTNGT